jgi:hypothetical protein
MFIKNIDAKYEHSMSDKKSFAFKTNKSITEVLMSYLELYSPQGMNSSEEISWDSQTFESYSAKTGITTIIYTKE